MKRAGSESQALARREKIATRFCVSVTSIVLAVLALATVYRDLRILLATDNSFVYPTSIYRILPLPAVWDHTEGAAAAGADFSQVYTSALALRHGESAYHPTSLLYQDRFGPRPPGYPPLTNWLYVPISLLPYRAALLAHSAVSLSLFLGVALFLLRRAGLARRSGSVSLVIVSLYLLTPIGLTHLERGQFDLFVAASVLGCLSCVLLRGNHPFLAVGSGILGAMKWTSAPFLFCFCGLGFLFAERRKRWVFLLMPAVVLLGTLPFWAGLKELWPSIVVYEVRAKPFGLTLQNFFPRWAARSVPPLITVAAAALVRAAGRSREARARAFESIAPPFALALASVSICFGTISYEYHTVTLLGMIPVIVVWTLKEPDVSDRIKAVTCAVFGGFLCVAFRLAPMQSLSPVVMTAVYCVCALVFLGVCVRIAAVRTKSPISAPARTDRLTASSGSEGPSTADPPPSPRPDPSRAGRA